MKLPTPPSGPISPPAWSRWAFGTGLRRSKTLAQGDAVCNFRYKKGRPVTQDWDTEVPKFSAQGRTF